MVEALIRSLLLVILFALPSYGQLKVVATLKGGTGVSPPLVNQTCNGGAFATNPSATCVFSSTTGAGDPLVIYIGNTQAVATIATPTGCSSSWTSAGHDATTNQSLYVGTATSSGTCTVTEAATSSVNTSLDIIGQDLQNTLTTTDVSPAFAAVSFCTASCTGPSNTTSTNGDMVLSFYVSGTDVTPISGNNYTQDLAAVNVNSGNTQLAGHLIQSSAGATNMSWTQTTGASGIGAIISLKP